MTGVRKLLLGVALGAVAASALAGHYMRLPATRGRARIEEVRMREPFPAGRLVFRARNPLTKAVLSVYETPLAPEAALAEVAVGLAADGWGTVLATPSLVLFERRSGACAAAQAVTADDGVTRVAVLTH